jgi:hypothetical protein
MTAKDIYWPCIRTLLALGLTLLALTLNAADNPIPVVHVLATDRCAPEEGEEAARFVAFRDGPTNAPLRVSYQVGGSASNGVDYRVLSGSVTIPAGARRAPIVVTPFDDNLVEGGETILLSLEQPLVWPPPYIVCWPSFAFGHSHVRRAAKWADQLAPDRSLRYRRHSVERRGLRADSHYTYDPFRKPCGSHRYQSH